MKGGRIVGFSRLPLKKLRSVDEVAYVSELGPDALTPGGKWVMEYLMASGSEPDSDKTKELNRTMLAAIHSHDAKFFEQVAATIKADSEGFSDYPLHCAALFVYVCRDLSRLDDGRGIRAYLEQSETIRAAWAKARYTPTLKEIHCFISEMMGDDAPDYSTVGKALRPMKAFRDVFVKKGSSARPTS